MPKRRPAAACRPSGPLNLSHAHHRGWRPGDRPCSATQERLCTHRESQARHGSAGWTGCTTSRSVCGQGGARLARAGAPRMQGMRSEAQGPWVRRACTPAAAGGGTGGAGSERRHFIHRCVEISGTLSSIQFERIISQSIVPICEQSWPVRALRGHAIRRRPSGRSSALRLQHGCSRRREKSRRLPEIGRGLSKIKPSADQGERTGVPTREARKIGLWRGF